MNNRYVLSSLGYLSLRAGTVVWDDPVHKIQLGLNAESWRVISTFLRPSTVEEACGSDLSRKTSVVVRDLIDYGVLVTADASHEEGQIVSAWDSWGLGARHFHYASRTTRETAFYTPEQDDERANQKLQDQKVPPPLVSLRGDVEYVNLPEEGRSRARTMGLVDALHQRRSVRTFSEEAIPLGDVAEILAHSARITAVTEPRLASAQKTVPSGGGRHPVDVYVRAVSIDGISPGYYHYDAEHHRIGRVADLNVVADTDVAVQPELMRSAMQIVFVGDRRRSAWKYETARAYRLFLMEVGHLSQTVYLLSTALNLGCVFFGAFRDDSIEKVLGLDDRFFVPLGMMAIGVQS